MSSLCLVCNASCDGRLRNGVVACQACKSFFLRSQTSANGLKCVTGIKNCFVGATGKRGVDGRRLRFNCPQCRFRRCQEVGMKPPKTIVESGKITDGQTNDFSLMPKITPDTSTKETLNSLIAVFMETYSASGNAIPGVVQDWSPQVGDREMTQTFLNNSDHVCRLFANFLKINPLYKRLTMADRCSTFFQCGTRLNRIFKAAPAAMNRSNFQKLQVIFPEFQVLVFFN